MLSPVIATIVGVIAGIALALATMLGIGLLLLAWSVAAISLATEDPNPFRAIGRGLRRTLVRPLLLRTVAAAAAVLMVTWFGAFVLVAFGGTVSLLTRIDTIAVVVSAAGGVVLNGLSLIFVMLYVRDVRLRREGSDLLAALGDLPQTA